MWKITDLLSGGGPVHVGSLAVWWLCLTRTQIHHMKITPTATSSTTDRLTAIATVCPIVRRGLPLLDCRPTVIEQEKIHVAMHSVHTHNK